MTNKMGTVIHITKQGLSSNVPVTIYGQSVINSGIPLVKSLFISVLTVLDNKRILRENIENTKLTLNRVRLIHTLRDKLTKMIRTRVYPILSLPVCLSCWTKYNLTNGNKWCMMKIMKLKGDLL